MEMLVLEASRRDASVKPRKLRKQNQIPAVCYGKGFETMTVQVDYQTFRKLFRKTGSSQVFNLDVEGKKVPVLVHDIAYDSVTDNFEHIDFLQVNMKENVTATVPVEVDGVSPAVKNFGGVLNVVKQEVEVDCLPMDIPQEIRVDISVLENIGDLILIKDLKVSDKVKILAEEDEVVVSVSAATEFKEEEVEVPEELKAEPTAESKEESK